MIEPNSNSLKMKFNEIKDLRDSVSNLLFILTEKVATLNNIYKDLLQNNLDETITGLDSLYFQSKLINIEIMNNNNIFKIIDNQIYCDYYKLYKSIRKYIQTNMTNTTFMSNMTNIKNILSLFDESTFPIYKDLDTKTHYAFENTIAIQEIILQILNILNDEYLLREDKLAIENDRKKTGLNIDTLINSVNYNNNDMKNNIDLFTEYLNIFNNFHAKYLTRFSLRAKLFYGQVNSDIHLEENKLNMVYISNNIDKLDKSRKFGDNINIDFGEESSIRSCINHKTSIESDLSSDNTIEGEINELEIMIQGINLNQQEPIIDEPIIAEPIIDEPSIDEPIIVEPIIVEHMIDEPFIDEPIIVEPIIVEPSIVDDSLEDMTSDSYLEYNVTSCCIQ
jgi:hypothetical protein